MLWGSAAKTDDLAEQRELAQFPVARKMNWIVVVLAATCIGFTCAMVQYSLQYGRLIIFPTYDDVGYFADAVARLRELYDLGVFTFVMQLKIRPPHSPFATALAMLSFLVFGIHDWAPYAGNILVVATLAVLVNLICWRLSALQRIAIWLFVLTLPLSGVAVTEFRPDVELALVIVAGILTTLSNPFIDSRPIHKILIGALFGAAMLIKPPAFPATLLMFLGSIILRIACDVLEQRRLDRKRLLSSLAICIPIFVLIILPFYAVAGQRTWNYFNDILFGRYRDIWQTKMSVVDQLLYYLSGPGGSTMLGVSVYALLALAAVGLVLTIARPGPARWRGCALYVMLCGAYLLVTCNQAKQFFFGLTFQVLLLAVALLALRDLLELQRERRHFIPWASAVLALVLGISVFLFRWPLRNGAFNDDWIVNRNEIVYGVFNTIAKHSEGRPAAVLLTSTGDINLDLMYYLTRKQFLPLKFDHAHDDDITLKGRTDRFDWADFVVASESGTTLTADFLPGNKVQDQVLDAIRKRADFRQIAQFPFRKFGKSFFVFQHGPSFGGYEEISGFSPREGPHPQWQLPRVQWGLGPKSVIRFHAHQAGMVSLRIDARTQVAGRTITIQLDGKQASRVVVNSTDSFDSFDVPLAVSAGAHEVELNYSEWNRNDAARPMAILFRTILIQNETPATTQR